MMGELRTEPGLHARDIKACAICEKGMCHANAMHFYKVTVQQHILDFKAIQKHSGMEQMMGGGEAGAVLADVLGPNDPLSVALPSRDVLICSECALVGSIGALIIATETE